MWKSIIAILIAFALAITGFFLYKPLLVYYHAGRLDSKNPAIRSAAKEALIGYGEAAFQRVYSCLLSKERDVRFAACDIFIKAGRAAHPFLIKNIEAEMENPLVPLAIELLCASCFDGRLIKDNDEHAFAMRLLSDGKPEENILTTPRLERYIHRAIKVYNALNPDREPIELGSPELPEGPIYLALQNFRSPVPGGPSRRRMESLVLAHDGSNCSLTVQWCGSGLPVQYNVKHDESKRVLEMFFRLMRGKIRKVWCGSSKLIRPSKPYWPDTKPSCLLGFNGPRNLQAKSVKLAKYIVPSLNREIPIAVFFIGVFRFAVSRIAIYARRFENSLAGTLLENLACRTRWQYSGRNLDNREAASYYSNFFEHIFPANVTDDKSRIGMTFFETPGHNHCAALYRLFALKSAYALDTINMVFDTAPKGIYGFKTRRPIPNLFSKRLYELFFIPDRVDEGSDHWKKVSDRIFFNKKTGLWDIK
jgi:hypothetical protein